MNKSLESMIKKDLRRLWLRSRYRAQIFQNENKRVHKVMGFYKNGMERTKIHWICDHCKVEKPRRDDFVVDHIKPIGHCTSWDEYVARLFCGPENLQLLCKPCNKTKTSQEKRNKAYEQVS